jgi:hypothetical protein
MMQISARLISFWRYLRTYLLTYVLLLVTFFFLLFLVYFIPTNLMYDEVESSAKTLSEQGMYYSLVGHDRGDQIDNYTIALMLNISSHNDGDIWQRPLLGGNGNYIKGSRNPIELLKSGYNYPANSYYTHYWHGWLVVIKPLLVFLDLVHIQQLFIIAMLALAGCACFEVGHWGWRYSVCLGSALLLVGFWRTAVSLPASFSFFIALLGCIFISHHERHLRATGGIEDSLWLGIFFFVVGAITNYFDFLDTPPITFGLPLLILVIARRSDLENRRWRDLLMLICISCVSWALGYGLLFVSKWILTTLLTGYDAILAALNEFLYRSGTTLSAAEGGSNFTRIDAIVVNVNMLIPRWTFVPLAVLLIVYLVALWRRGLEHPSLQFIICILVISAIPFVWYLFASNHSYLHCWFTYRDLVVTLFGIFVLLGSLLRFDDGASSAVV